MFANRSTVDETRSSRMLGPASQFWWKMAWKIFNANFILGFWWLWLVRVVFPKVEQCKWSCLISCFISSKVRPASKKSNNQSKECFEMLRNVYFSRQVVWSIEDVVFDWNRQKVWPAFYSSSSKWEILPLKAIVINSLPRNDFWYGQFFEGNPSLWIIWIEIARFLFWM